MLEIVEPPTHTIKTHIIPLKVDDEFIIRYDSFKAACRAIYNMAVHEAMFDGPERRAFTSYIPKDKDGKKKPIYMPEKLIKQIAEDMDMEPKEIKRIVRSELGGVAWGYAFPPKSWMTRNRIRHILTEMRAAYNWCRECPARYGEGAIYEAVTAVDRAISDNSDWVPFRKNGKYAPLFCPSNHAHNEKRRQKVAGARL